LIKTNGKFIDSNNKQIGRKRATLMDTTLGREGGGRLTVHKNRKK
jgi:hypothetical protein